jgi:uncharacterized membrane protein (DUF2068 family)
LEKIHPTKALEKIHPTKTGVHVIAIFEAVKGTLGIAAGFGILSLLHRDIPAFAADLIEVLHLNSESHLAHRIVETVTRLNPSNLKIFFILALVYSAVRFVEAYGLWRLRAWAEWFAIISGALYVPVEIYEVFQKFTVFRVGVLLVNIGVVIYLYSFRREQKHDEEVHQSQIAGESL